MSETQNPQTKESFQNWPGYRVESGVKVAAGDLKGKVSDYSVITDEGQGHTWYKDGYYKHVNHGTNYEICGTRLQEKDYAKILTAASGHIMLDAQDGDIILKGRNIRISATDGQGEVTITSGKHIFLKGSVTHIRGTNINIFLSFFLPLLTLKFLVFSIFLEHFLEVLFLLSSFFLL